MALTISGTTGIALPDGSVAAPSTRGQDANSGVSYGADSIKFSTGGVERFAVSNSGISGDGSGLTGTSGLTQLAETSTSGADNYTWESIPAGFKRLTLIFQKVSFDADSNSIKIELGGSSYYTSGYQGTSGFIAGTGSNANEFGATDSFMAYQAVAATSLTGHAVITPTTTGTSSTYVYSFQGTHQDGSAGFGAGHLTGVTDAITKVKIRSSGSADFDGGTVGILYEV